MSGTVFCFPGTNAKPRVSLDQNIPDQQNLTQGSTALVILCGRTNRLRELAILVSAAISAVDSIRAGDVVKVR